MKKRVSKKKSSKVKVSKSKKSSKITKKTALKQQKSKKKPVNTKKSTHVTDKKNTDKQQKNTKKGVDSPKKKRIYGRPWKKGKSGNPKGRPPLGLTKLDNLTRAISTVEMNKKKSLLEHFIARAFKSDTVLIALMKKRHPDLKSVMMQVNQHTEEDRQAAAKMRKEMQRRMQPESEKIKAVKAGLIKMNQAKLANGEPLDAQTVALLRSL